MTDPIDPAMAHQLRWMVDDLCSEFAGQFSRGQIEEIMIDSRERVLATATVFDFVPLMAYRFTRERLEAIARASRQEPDADWDVVFVSLSGGGRSQIAAALTGLISAGRVSVHAAGTAVDRPVDPGVRVAIEELGLDPDRQFARPVTDEVLAGADVIVTLGHSVGVVEIPLHARHADWRVGDPLGASIEEIRRIRGDIAYRVRDLLAELGVVITDSHAATRVS